MVSREGSGQRNERFFWFGQIKVEVPEGHPCGAVQEAILKLGLDLREIKSGHTDLEVHSSKAVLIS